jgi:hypothetical protein
MADEQDIPTGQEAPGGEAEGATTSDKDSGATSFHYQTHEAAEEAARRFQGEKDKLDAYVEKIRTLPDGTKIPMTDLPRIASAIFPLADRSDFEDYIRGNLVKKGEAVTEPDDEFLTDTERAHRDEVGALRGKVAQQGADLAWIFWNQKRESVEGEWGGLLEPYRKGAEQLFEQLIQVGGIKDARKIDSKFVRDLYLRQIPEEELDPLLQRRGQMASQKQLEHQQAKGTTVPSQERAAEAKAQPKNLRDALRMGMEVAAAEAARGGR